nr:aminodeoxychorismate synthase component I [Solemya pervernicosa gill symbiont]
MEIASKIDLLDLHRFNRERYPHLLESVLHGTAQARYDILFAFPDHYLTLMQSGDLSEPLVADQEQPFLVELDRWWSESHVESTSSILPFSGGWFLYLGYELAGEIEPTLKLPATRSQFPIAMAVRHPAAVIVDHQAGTTHLVVEAGREEQLASLQADIEAVTQSQSPRTQAISARIEEEPAERYLDAVERILSYIREGDVFQVNLSREWSGTLQESVTAADLYSVLRTTNPAPFAALATFGESAVVSSSPERLVSVHDGVVQTRPIAGTRPRSERREDDQVLSETLMSHPKEQAEHIMLIDLERNDLGRVSVPGSVEVDELMVLESYAHVHHIVSNVRGRLREGVTPGEVIRATFPGGTITGCPKVRCMEIIAELEQTGRGPYTGSIGYLNRDGSMDLNILIRTMLLEQQQVTFRAGAGIVTDSIAERELEETRAKALGMLRALEPQS